MTILTIDPGKRSIAWALWRSASVAGYALVDVGFMSWVAERFEEPLHTLRTFVPPADLVVVEIPRIYPRERTKNPNDLIDLSVTAGACASLGALRILHPAEWKGQTPKAICHDRARASLSRAETFVLSAGLSKQKNAAHEHMLDAVAIGVWFREHGGT